MRALRGDSETQRHIGHGEDYDTLVRGGVLGNAPKTGLEQVVAVEERHLRSGLYPHL